MMLKGDNVVLHLLSIITLDLSYFSIWRGWACPWTSLLVPALINYICTERFLSDFASGKGKKHLHLITAPAQNWASKLSWFLGSLTENNWALQVEFNPNESSGNVQSEPRSGWAGEGEQGELSQLLGNDFCPQGTCQEMLSAAVTGFVFIPPK